jgi:hypothetical protein
VPIFPPAPVTILIDGRPLEGYSRAYLARDRVFAPVEPLLTTVADRIWYDGSALIIERGARRVVVRLGASPNELDSTFVPAGAVLRALGASVWFDPKKHRLVVRLPARAVATPTPFDPTAPSAPPAAVFTPAPSPAPRPVWTGPPLPRRTPLPLPPAVRER